MQSVMVCGDIHGDWGSLNKIINKKSPDIIFQCGDFGWWPHYHGTEKFGRGKIFDQYGIKNKSTKIYWIGGNHENWNDLTRIADSGMPPVETQPGVTYCPFGAVIECNGYNILMVGGAESIDKEYRVENDSWWRNEIISQKDMDNLPDCDIDVVISHTIPRSWFNAVNWGFTDKGNDPSTFALDLILNKYKPKKWFSGHFHHYMKCEISGCEWTALDCTNSYGQWYDYLK